MDLCSVATSGNVAGVRQIANRILRAIPPEVTDADVFREQLTQAVAGNGAAKPRRTTAPPADSESRIGLLHVEHVDNPTPLVLPDDPQGQLDAVVTEWQASDRLRAANISPTQSILLTGPPGVGKTLAARWLAAQLGLPLISADLAGLVSSYLGNTGRNLRRVLDYAAETPCVLFLDEFDALAKRRDDDTDVGELKRIVNVLLLELERWPSHCLLVAATNHPELLDRAVERRFDRTIELPTPGPSERVELFRTFTAPIEAVSDEALIGAAALTPGATGSDIRRRVSDAARAAILADTALSDALTAGLIETFDAGAVDRDNFCLVAHDSLGLTQRQIAKLLNVTHPTVGAAIRRARAAQ